MGSGAGVMMWRMGYVHNAEMIKIASKTVTERASSPIKSQCDALQSQSWAIQCQTNHWTRATDKIFERHANIKHAQRESPFIINTLSLKKAAFHSHPKGGE